MEQQNNICKDWRELNTPFGKLYIEPWAWHSNNLYPYDRDDRITIYDSRGNWFDYFSLDYFYIDTDGLPLELQDMQAKGEYERLCEMLTLGAEKETLQEFLDWIGILWCYAGPDKEQAAFELSDGHPEELLPDELETNEYVNHIGENYIVVAEC
ncbi:MAG: hypothetical protein K2K81_10300 [Muribaculaceae bacterium]|nr:hypothetical protein [Muribaculaceae bacterium]